MELHIINQREQIIDVIQLEKYYYIKCENSSNTTTINNCYMVFIYYLKKPIQYIIDNLPFNITDEDLIYNTKIQDCSLVITKLKSYLNKDDYYVKLIKK